MTPDPLQERVARVIWEWGNRPVDPTHFRPDYSPEADIAAAVLADLREAGELREYEQFYREQLASERRSAAALRGHITRLKNRIVAGVCPVPGCKRSGFSNVMRHVASKHPEWHADHAHDLA